jgi:monoamine oxidase
MRDRRPSNFRRRAVPRIAIVGAGIAGLTAALTLRDAGISCHVYDASDRIGGRMHSDAITWADGMVSEWCGEFIDGDHETIHQLVARFGLSTIDLGREPVGGAPSLMYFFQRFYAAKDLARDFQAIAPLLRQQMREADYPTTYARFTPAGFALDQLSVNDWIEQYVPGGHTVPLGHFLDAACSGFYGLDTGEQSALNLVYVRRA